MCLLTKCGNLKKTARKWTENAVEEPLHLAQGQARLEKVSARIQSSADDAPQRQGGQERGWPRKETAPTFETGGCIVDVADDDDDDDIERPRKEQAPRDPKVDVVSTGASKRGRPRKEAAQSADGNDDISLASDRDKPVNSIRTRSAKLGSTSPKVVQKGELQAPPKKRCKTDGVAASADVSAGAKTLGYSSRLEALMSNTKVAAKGYSVAKVLEELKRAKGSVVVAKKALR